MDQEIRNKLRNVVTQCRKLLEDSVSQELEGKYSIFAKKDHVVADPDAEMTHLTEEEKAARKDILDHLGHIKARGFKPKDALDQLVREIAFTHLNRLCAYKMMEVRDVYVGGQKFREAVSRGINSNGVKFYLADNPEEERLFRTGHQDVAYRHFLDWLGGLLSDEIGVLFNPSDSANRLYPPQKTLDEVLDLLNGGGIKAEETDLREQWSSIWSQDETIGWAYQYFTPKEVRDQARKESAAPRNSYELAFRNQFFTPRYVVEFLTDNTLGRIWYEIRKGDTKLKDQCRYLVRRPTEIFLKEGEQPPKEAAEGRDDLSQEELLKLPVFIPHRPKKDPRELKILDPACGSAHFLLYCFDLLLTIYEEAYADPDLGPALQTDYPNLEDLQRDVPRLILAHNLHGIDIDPRATQIAGLALWLRCQRAYQEMGLKKERPKITRSNIVCAEPMPGEKQMLQEFVSQLEPKFLGQVVEVVFDKMKLAGEAGSLLKIEEEIRDTVASAKKQWLREMTHATDRKGRQLLFTQAEMDRIAGRGEQSSLFDLSDITDTQFFERAEAEVLKALHQYAEKAQNGQTFQRRLFTEDAVRGFALIDLCQRRYDVTLMNPPFGEPSDPSRAYLSDSYPKLYKNLLSSFIARTLERLCDNGKSGAIVSRTFLFLPDFAGLRDQVLKQGRRLVCCSELGEGVLDTATVRVAAFIYDLSENHDLVSFFRHNEISVQEKQHDLLKLIKLHREAAHSERTYLHFSSVFASLPNTVFSYTTHDDFLKLFRRFKALQPAAAWIRRVPGTGDNESSLRLMAEVPEDEWAPAGDWVPYAKGGGFAPFMQPPQLMIRSNLAKALYSEQRLAGFAIVGRPRSENLFGIPSLTFSYANDFGLDARPLPAGSLFDSGGPAVFAVEPNSLVSLLAILNSRVVRRLLFILTPERFKQVGLVQRLPVPQFLPDQLASEAATIVDSLQIKSSFDEISCYFTSPLEWQSEGFLASVVTSIDMQLNCELTALASMGRMDELSCTAYGLGKDTRLRLAEEVGPLPTDYPTTKCDFQKSKVRKSLNWPGKVVGKGTLTCSYLNFGVLERASHALKAAPASLVDNGDFRRFIATLSRKSCAQDFVSWAVGCSFGRYGTQSAPRKPPDMFVPLSSLARPNGDKAEGIRPDDDSHAEDIVRQVAETCSVLWPGRSDEEIWAVADALGVKTIREYLRDCGAGGFWANHLKRYTKAPRKAPIYWLLQSSKRNYSLWLYFHRLDKDLLFKALVNYVEPKNRLEASRLETLRSQMAVAGGSGKEAKRLAKEVERQEDFLSELRDFEEKLRRAANLHLEPDLNDGVVLNIAPLHELVPWKEAKKYWEELLEGKYEWSSIGKQLRERGLVK